MLPNFANKKLEELLQTFSEDLKDKFKFPSEKAHKLTYYAYSSEGKNPGLEGIHIDIEYLQTRGGYRLVVGVGQIKGNKKLSQKDQELLMKKIGLVNHDSKDLRADDLDKEEAALRTERLVELIKEEKMFIEKRIFSRKKSRDTRDEETQVVNSESDKWTLGEIISLREKLMIPDPPDQPGLDNENYRVYCFNHKRYKEEGFSLRRCASDLKKRWVTNPLGLFVIGVTHEAKKSLAAGRKKGFQRAHLFSCKSFAHYVLESPKALDRDDFLKLWWYANVTIIGLDRENDLLESKKYFESLSVMLINNEISSPGKDLPLQLPKYFECTDSGFKKSTSDIEMVKNLCAETISVCDLLA